MNAQGVGNCGQDKRRLLHVRKVHQRGRVRRGRDGLDGDPCFADTAGTGQRDERNITPFQEFLDTLDLTPSSNK